MKRAPDRRIRRTRHRLKAALLELLQERAYERISIEDIAERADVGRSTFYTHFESKEDLLFDGFDAWMRSLAEPPQGAAPGEPRFHFSRPLLEHVQSQRRFFLAAFVKGNDLRIRARFTALLADVVEKELARLSPRRGAKSAAMPRALAHALAAAWLGLVAWWLSEGSATTVAEVDRAFQKIGRAGLA